MTPKFLLLLEANVTTSRVSIWLDMFQIFLVQKPQFDLNFEAGN